MIALGGLAGRRDRLLLGAALLGAGALLIPADSIGGAALRACGLLASLGFAARALRSVAPAPRALAVVEQQPLGRGGGLAVVEVDGRRLLLGYAPAGPTLLLDLTAGNRP